MSEPRRSENPTGSRRRRLTAVLTSLKLQITLGGIAALVLGIGLNTVLLLNRAEHDMLKTQQQWELGESAQGAAVLARRVVDLQRALQSVAAQLDAPTLADNDALIRFVEAKPVLRGLFASVLVAGPDGVMRVFADANGVRSMNVILSDRDYFRRTMAEDRPIVSEPIPGKISGEPVIVLTHPIRDANGVSGVLGGSLRLASRDLLADMVDSRLADTDVLLVVTDARGRILAHPNRTRLMSSLADEPRLSQAFKAWVESASAVEPAGLLLPQDGEVVSAAGVPGPDWMLWRARPQRELLAPLHAARREALAWAAGLIALLSAALLAFLWWRLRPLHLLEQRAQHLFDGALDPNAGWPHAQGEIGHLGRVLQHVGAERAKLEILNNHVLRRLGSVMSAAPLGIAFTREGRFELVSAEFCRLFGRDEPNLLGQSARMVFASNEDGLALTRQANEAFDAHRPYGGEWRMLRSDGTSFWAHVRGKPVDAGDMSEGIIWTVNDISAEMAEREDLEWSATHDSLTGLANRKHFEQRAARLMGATQGATAAAIVFIDLDHFKPINDSAGHAAGDAMLRAVAAAITSRVRAVDLVVRLGGDEFALLLDRCSHDIALRVAENVRSAIADIALPWEDRTLHVGASLGVASLAPETATVAAWLEAADTACYAAKAAGRGTVRTASGAKLRVVADSTKAASRQR